MRGVIPVLIDVQQAGHAADLLAGPPQRRHQQGNQNPHNGDDHQQLD
jgi:hypothetical protein